MNQTIEETIQAVQVFQGDRNIPDKKLQEQVIKTRITRFLSELTAPPKQSTTP